MSSHACRLRFTLVMLVEMKSIKLSLRNLSPQKSNAPASDASRIRSKANSFCKSSRANSRASRELEFKNHQTRCPLATFQGRSKLLQKDTVREHVHQETSFKSLEFTCLHPTPAGKP